MAAAAAAAGVQQQPECSSSRSAGSGAGVALLVLKGKIHNTAGVGAYLHSDQSKVLSQQGASLPTYPPNGTTGWRV